MGVSKGKCFPVRLQDFPYPKSSVNAPLERILAGSVVEGEIEVNSVEESLLDQDDQGAICGARGIVSTRFRIAD